MANPLPLLAALVGISVTGTDAESGQQQVVASCVNALGKGMCVTAAAEASPHAYDATVALQGDELRVVLVSREGEALERELSFSPADGLEQRWVAAGLLVAAMIAAMPQTDSKGGTANDPALPNPPKGEPPPASATNAGSRRRALASGRRERPSPLPARSTGGIGVGATAVPTTRSRSPWYLGARLEAQGSVGDWAELILGGSADRALESDSVRTRVSVSGGPSVRILSHGRAVQLWLGGYGQTQWVLVSPRDVRGATARWVTQFGGGLELRSVFGGLSTGPWVAVRCTLVEPEFVVRVDGREVSRSALVEPSFALGWSFEVFPGGAR